MKKNKARIFIGLMVVLVLLAHVHGELRIPFIDNLESIISDARLRLTMPRTVDARVVILDIDEKSLEEPERGGEGRWPWPRSRLAFLLDKLFDHYQVSIVGFDVVFSERDPSSGLRVLEKLSAEELKGVPQFQSALEQLKPQLDFDQLFAQSMKDRQVVLGYTFQGIEIEKGALPPAIASVKALASIDAAVRSYEGFTGNLPEFVKNAASAGHFNPHVESDGITRRVPMLAEYKGQFYEPLSLAMVRQIFGGPPVRLYIEDEFSAGYGTLEAIGVGRYRIPVDSRGTALIPYRGPRGSFAYHSLVDVMNDRVPVEQLRGKIVLIGTSAPGLLDLRATPVEPAYPGVEIHANMIAGILDQAIKHQPGYALGVEIVMIFVLGVALALWLPLLPAHYAMLVSLTAFVLAVGINVSFYHYAHMVLPLAATLALILTLFVVNMAYGFLIEGRNRRQITGLFGQYVPKEVVDDLANNPERASMEGESREMTVLFTDVRGFTTISEGLEPKALSQLMNEFLTPLTEVIYRHRGTIDKYMGDCIMAFWGAPLPDPNHARNGVLAGLEMQRRLKELQPYFASKNWPPIRIGVGLNTGRMSVGNMGSRVRLAYTVMGDAVNLASRLEGLTKEYGADIIVGEETKKAVPGVVYRELDRVRVKGKDTAVTIFEPIGVEGEVGQAMLDEIALFHEALEFYRRQEWQMAEQRLLELVRLRPDSMLYELFLGRVAMLRPNPPGEGWDGAFTFEHK